MGTYASELIGDVKTGGSLGCNNHVLMEFAFLSDLGPVKSKYRTLTFGKANFQHFRELVSKTGKLASGTREQNRAGISVRTLSIEHTRS